MTEDEIARIDARIARLQAKKAEGQSPRVPSRKMDAVIMFRADQLLKDRIKVAAEFWGVSESEYMRLAIGQHLQGAGALIRIVQPIPATMTATSRSLA